MKLYKYFNIGPGVIVPYSDESNFNPSFVQTRPFSQTGEEGNVLSKKKKRSDREICNLLFCPVATCTCSFDTRSEYDAHLLSELHVFPQKRSSMDFVRSSFVEKLKATSQLFTETTNLETDIATQTLTQLTEVTPMMTRITDRGWALPQRQFFRYNYEQKKMLYDLFMEGERTGKKKSPDEAHMLIRKALKPAQWVTPTQIRSLFSTFSKKLKAGNLEPPVKKTAGTAKQKSNPCTADNGSKDEMDDVEIVEEVQQEVPEYILNSDIQREVFEVMAELAEWDVDEYVAVIRNDYWCPGKITGIRNDGCDVICMEYVERSPSNKFEWSETEKSQFYLKEDLLLKIDPPTKSGSKRRFFFTLTEEDFSGASDLFDAIMETR